MRRREYHTGDFLGSDSKILIENLDIYGRAAVSAKKNARMRNPALIDSVDCGRIRRYIFRKCDRLSAKLGKPEYARFIEWKLNPNGERHHANHYRSKLQGASLVIFPGGGIIECSTNHNMFGWSIMRRAVNRSCVRSMTCRDGVEWINQNLYGGRNFATALPCGAILAGQMYGVRKDPSSNTIGIGVIRGSAFEVYGNPITQEQKWEAEIRKKTAKMLSYIPER